MKTQNLSLVQVILFICLLNTGFNAQWVNIAGFNNNVRSLTFNGNNLFAAIGGSNGGVFISSNNGSNWVQTFFMQECIPLTVSGNNIFTGTLWNGVFLSSNNGINWSSTSLTNYTIISLTVSGSRILAGPSNGTTGLGVQYTSNNGSNWIQSSFNDRWVLALSAEDSNIFAGTYDAGVYKSSNMGTDWTQTALNNRKINALAVTGSRVLAGTDNFGVYISTNSGISWEQSSLNSNIIRSFAIFENTIIAGTFQNGVYVSTNNGLNWVQRNEGIGNAVVYSLCIFNNYIFAGTLNNIFKRQLNELTGIYTVSNVIPAGFSLSQNYPNPFNPVTRIKFDISSAGFVKLVVYDITGKEISELVNNSLKAGTFSVDFDGSNFPSGVYFCKLTAGSFTGLNKMVLIK